MSWRDFLLRARALVFRHRMEEELDDELRSHLELQTRKHLAAGLTIEEAERRARVEFGGVELAKEECRDARRVNVIDNLFEDLRYAMRGLRRDPALALAALLTLAVSIGANTTMFSVMNSVVLRPLPFPASERLFWLSELVGKQQREVGLGADYYSLREQNRVFNYIAAYDTLTLNWTGVEKPEQLDAAQVTPSFFNVLAVEPMMGRYLAPDEEGRQAPNVVVLSYAFWRSRLGSDPHQVGKTITLDSRAATVIGIMPQGFDYPKGTEVWRPLPMDEASQRPRLVTQPMRQVNMIARLQPQVSRTELDTDLGRLTNAIVKEYPKEFASAGFLDGMKILAVPLQRRILGNLRPALLVLSGAVALVLLIACANLANLVLARAAARRRELAVRMALGAGRRRIVRQVLTESLALALPGGIGGIVVAYLAVEALNAWKPLVLASYPPILLDVSTLAFTFGLTILTALVFGMAPAIAAAGIRVPDTLKSASHMHSGGRGAKRLRHVLVVAELAVALVLLIGAGLLARSFMTLSNTELGFSPGRLLTLQVNLVGSRYAKPESQKRFFAEVLERLDQLPMLRQAAASTDIPLSGEGPYSGVGVAFQVAGRVPVPVSQQPRAGVTMVSRDFFRTLGIPVREGRTFDSQDTSQRVDNIVVNEAFVRKIFPGESPLGKGIVFGQNESSRWTIVGVVGSIRGSHLGADPAPLVYRCICQSSGPFLSRMGFLIRTADDPRQATRAIEAQIYAADRNQPVFDVKTMEERLAASLAPQGFYLLLIGIFALIAVALAAIGVYGVMSYLVALRTREIGIRVAMGARLGHVLRLVLGESLALMLMAVVVGLGCAWGLTRYLESMLYGVTALDKWTFAMMPAVLGIIALTASLVPAIHALQVDPTTALREE